MEEVPFDPAALLAGLTTFIVIAVVGYVVFSAAVMVIARKTGTPRPGLAWIPVANVYLMCRIGGTSLIWMVLLVVPLINILAIVVIWAGIARVRGRSPALGVLILIPLINLVLPWYLASGSEVTPLAGAPGTQRQAGARAATGKAAAAAPVAVACPRCGATPRAGKRFCEACGFEIAAVRPVTAPATAPAGPARLSPVAAVAMLLAIVAVGGLGYVGFAMWRGGSAGPGRAPAMSPRMAGTLTEFPVDTAASNRARPDAVVTQTFTGSKAARVQVPQTWLPAGLTRERLPQHAEAVTAATYRVRPEDPPVSVTVMQAAADQARVGPRVREPDDPAGIPTGPSGVFPSAATAAIDDANNPAVAARQEIARDIATAANAERRGVRVQSPDGDTYLGHRIGTPQSLVFVLSKVGAPIVVVIFAPDASVIPVAERLAANVGNGNGLADEPALTEALGSLPPELPSDLTLVEAGTYTADELTRAADLSAFGDDAAAREWAVTVRRFIPARVMTARYRDTQDRDWGVVQGMYGSTASAWGTWTALRWTVGLGAMQSIDVGGVTGLYADADDIRVMMFQRGRSIVVLVAPSAAALERLRTLAASFQL